MSSALPRVKRALARLVREALARGLFLARRTSYSAVSGNEAAVLMCLWNRPGRIDDVLRQLDAQEHDAGVRLYLWNNKRSDHRLYARNVEAFVPRGALHRVDLVKTPFNLGSIARFYWAARIGRRSPTAPVIVLDDDQDVPPDFVRTALSAYRADRVSAWWAFRRTGHGYWDREPSAPGDPVDHVGPGGSILDAGLMADGEFFRRIPEEFWFLDDIWLTFFAREKGRTLEKLDVRIDFVLHETNQYHAQIDQKVRFFDLLYSRAEGRGGGRGGISW